MFEKIDVLEARSSGYWNFRIPVMCVTPGGAVLATAEGRYGSSDWASSNIVMRRSTDGGRTWGPLTVFDHFAKYGPGPMNNTCLISDPAQKCTHAVYDFDYYRMFYRRSNDDGVTWTEPVEITSQIEQAFSKIYPYRVIAGGPNHCEVLRNGRLVIPTWMSPGTGKMWNQGDKLPHNPSVVSLIYSDDHGKTWLAGDIVCPNEGDYVNPGETVMVELSDGSVLFNIRNESKKHRRLISISPDGVHNWSKPVFDDNLAEPVCMATLARHSWPKNGKPGRILFANPDTTEQSSVNASWNIACDRKKLSVKVSYDDCKSWKYTKVIEQGLSSYADLGVLPDGKILIMYERGGSPMDNDNKRGITIARFDLDWLTDGKDKG